MSDARILGVDRARPIVEIGLGVSWGASATAGVWDVSLWDDTGARWGRTEPYWVDVTCETIAVSTFTGYEQAGDDWEVGTASVTVRNLTGWADYPPSTVVDPDVAYQLSLRPGRPIRIGVSVDGGDPVWMWRGYIDEANPDYVASEGDVVNLECVDAKGEAGRAELAQLAAPVGAGETVYNRINRYLTALQWRTGAPWRDIAASEITTIATDHNGVGTDLLNIAAGSAGGSIWGDLKGGVAFRAQDWQTWHVDDPPDGIIGEYGPPELVDLVEAPPDSGLVDAAASNLDIFESPVGSGLYDTNDADVDLYEDPANSYLFALAVHQEWPTVCPSSWEITFARSDYATQVIVGQSGVEPRPPFNDIPGRDLIGVEVFKRVDLETETNTALDMVGSRLLVLRGVGGAPRVNAVTIDAATADNTVDLITTVDPRIPSRYICRHRRPETGVDVFNRQMFATSVEHDIAPDTWTCRIGLSDAAPWAIGVAAAKWAPTVDPADEGLWNSATWSRRTVLYPEVA